MRIIFRRFINTSALISFSLLMTFCCSVYESLASDSLSTLSHKFSVNNTTHSDAPCHSPNSDDCHGSLEISDSQLKNNAGINLTSSFLKASKGDYSPTELLHNFKLHPNLFPICSLPPRQAQKGYSCVS